MGNKDPIIARTAGYLEGREGEPSHPPNDQGFLHDLIAKTPQEREADKAYREGFQQGDKDRKRRG